MIPLRPHLRKIEFVLGMCLRAYQLTHLQGFEFALLNFIKVFFNCFVMHELCPRQVDAMPVETLLSFQCYFTLIPIDSKSYFLKLILSFPTEIIM